jgi:aspartate/tyrosine/aromatic aminotransferase
MLCSVLCEDEKQAVAVKSQLQQLARPMYSNPPVHGALVVSTILSDPQLKKLWLKEVKVDYHSTILWLFFFFFLTGMTLYASVGDNVT